MSIKLLLVLQTKLTERKVPLETVLEIKNILLT